MVEINLNSADAPDASFFLSAEGHFVCGILQVLLERKFSKGTHAAAITVASSETTAAPKLDLISTIQTQMHMFAQ